MEPPPVSSEEAFFLDFLRADPPLLNALSKTLWWVQEHVNPRMGKDVVLANWGVGNRTSCILYPRGEIGLDNHAMEKSKSTNGRSFPLRPPQKISFANL